MEAAFANLLEPGDKVVVCINGVFGMRMAENVRRRGGELITVDDDWGKQVDPQKLEETLAAHPDAKVVGFVHAETSTGVCSDVETLCQIAKKAGCLTIVDAVTAVGGIELRVDDWGADVVYAGTQKCLSCPPGISLITFSQSASERVKSRNKPVQSWFLDMSLLMAYWEGEGGRAYHHTAPVNAMYGLHEALLMLHEEGLENSWSRHRAMHEKLVAGLEPLGLEFAVDAAYRLPQLNVVAAPEGVDEAAVRKQLLSEYNLEIGAGLGVFAGKRWRIGLMGYAARAENVLLCVSGMQQCLSDNN
jgi:alanine-glyoxylate transaminase/serine-glyoxylate transaminase/serine-pyruvate transaminase